MSRNKTECRDAIQDTTQCQSIVCSNNSNNNSGNYMNMQEQEAYMEASVLNFVLYKSLTAAVS